MILDGSRDFLELGNLDSKRDWGHAKDYCRGMWLMLQQEKPEDYVLSTNEFHSVREFVELAFSLRGFDIRWEGEGLQEVGVDTHTNRTLVKVNRRYFRPCEVDELLGDSRKAKIDMGWDAQTSFQDLVKEMVDYDCPLN
jgi:GDPmannose 4,6-dehydratase